MRGSKEFVLKEEESVRKGNLTHDVISKRVEDALKVWTEWQRRAMPDQAFFTKIAQEAFLGVLKIGR